MFFSFYYKADNWRVSTVKKMGAIEGQPLLSSNKWEEVKGGGDAAIKKWINDEMSGKSCLVVLIGASTAGRKWIDYEIKKAWDDGKGVVGVHIHGLKNSQEQQAAKGANPFAKFKIGDEAMTKYAKSYDTPYTSSKYVYEYISENIAEWVEEAIRLRKAA
ncbi:TIR domain-containing protein [Pontixanthobacter gangjinensis]|uniref:TIR domain-containing protein n=1 Tax=Pontixanthobacter gangjinensis TaxID=1028742 RepID=UPI001926DCD1|nr:TIR domain-containing protein [Pontixanthobacter gangjinensis]